MAHNEMLVYMKAILLCDFNCAGITLISKWPNEGLSTVNAHSENKGFTKQHSDLGWCLQSLMQSIRNLGYGPIKHS